MTPQSILRVLSQHPDNNITEFHRALNSVGGKLLGGGATGGVTLNYHEPYYTWRNFLESTHIQYNHISRIRAYLDAEPWGNVNLGGTIYRLKPVDIDAAISALSIDHYSKVIDSRGLKPKTLKEYNGKIRILRTIIDNVPVESITTKDIASILASYSADGKTTTAKLMRIALLDIFREAIADGHITNNPVEATRNPRSEIKRSRLSLSEYKEIYHCSLALQPWIPLSIELALMTGQRVSDISKIKWKDIRDGMLWIEQKKTGNKLVIDLSLTLDAIGVNLKDTVDRCKVLFGRFDNIICSQTGTQLTTTTMARGFAKARELSGIQWEKEPPSFHELRSLSARLYTEEKGTEFAQRLLGHKSAVMTAKYQDNRGSEWVKVATLL